MLGINNNIGNNRAQDAMAFNNAKLQVSLERLSTGIRINRAEDDSAGLLLRDRFQAQANGLEEAIRNIQAAQGMIQVAEEGMNRITETLQQMRQLAVRASDDNFTNDDRAGMQEQIKALLKEINDRAEKTRYNGHRLLDGSISEAVDERRAAAEVQTNSFLRNGTHLLEIGFGATTSNATSFGAVCQGSYEVKLVFNTASNLGSVDAQVFWTDGGGAVQFVTTLSDVTGGGKTVYTGGVLITVNQVSRHDTGLVAYAKTLKYVSATSQDSALQFQVGSDEGEIFRVGIQALTVSGLFRNDFYRGEDTEGSISVATHLQAQDLIGQIDDALSIAGGAQVKVGSFKNALDRTLELQRANHTQMLGAFSNINDADMAIEATDQGKRNILIQSGTAMIAQANASAQFVLQLLR
jgi:flagellin